MCFYDFFGQYKRRLKDLSKTSFKKEIPLYLKIIVAIYLFILFCGTLTLYLYSYTVGFAIMIVDAVFLLLFLRFGPNNDAVPDDKDILASKRHMEMVLELLKEYNISPDNPSKIKLLIDYAAGEQLRHDILTHFTKPFHKIRTPVAAIIGFVAAKIGDILKWNDLILISLQVIFILFMAMWILAAILFAVEDIIYPDKIKYQNLIDDLNQVILFYSPDQDD